ncbi:MAG: pyridoxamine 5'-phosphate oxidase family protein [Actinomycetota bacterium]|nr:pyridoxamine 5'-phosphate oxidase family protein [Actinomycetota bacterium]
MAVCVDALPVVFAVAYRLLGDDVVFRAGAASSLRSAAAQAIVAFEVDEFDDEMQAGWSVVVTGAAKELSDPRDIAAAEALGLPPWESDEPGRWLRVRTQMVIGRRMAAAPVVTVS